MNEIEKFAKKLVISRRLQTESLIEIISLLAIKIEDLEEKIKRIEKEQEKQKEYEKAAKETKNNPTKPHLILNFIKKEIEKIGE